MGKTMRDFFVGWKPDKIAQLYFHNEVPVDGVCKSYFRITDLDMVKSIFKSPGMTFNGVNPNEKAVKKDGGIQARLYQMGAKRKSYGYFFRNLLWQLRKWKTRELMSWIDEFNPEVAFYAAGDYIFSMKIALDICRMRNIPMIAYFGDDFYFLESDFKSPIERLNRWQFRKQFEELFSYLSTFTAATDKLNEKYSSYFGKAGHGILSSTGFWGMEARNQMTKISYIGNLFPNRWKALIDIGRCLKELGFVIDVYSTQKDPKILAQLNLVNGIHFQGGIPPNLVVEVIKASTIVVHAEALDDVSKRLTKYSLSTKIGDLLGSGVCLFAYGPAEVASIEYLIANDAACVCTLKDELGEKLLKILKDAKLRQHYVSKALDLAALRHDLAINADLFYEMVRGVVR